MAQPLSLSRVDDRRARVAAVTLGLVGAGATFGALAGGISLASALLLTEGDTSGFGFILGAILGTPLGAVIGPTLALSMLRRVPLGRLFFGCSLGTVLGGVVGWVFSNAGAQALMGLVGAFIGCMVAATMLRFRTHEKPEADDCEIDLEA